MVQRGNLFLRSLALQGATADGEAFLRAREILATVELGRVGAHVSSIGGKKAGDMWDSMSLAKKRLVELTFKYTEADVMVSYPAGAREKKLRLLLVHICKIVGARASPEEAIRAMLAERFLIGQSDCKERFIEVPLRTPPTAAVYRNLYYSPDADVAPLKEINDILGVPEKMAGMREEDASCGVDTP